MSVTSWQLTALMIAVVVGGLFIIGWRQVNRRQSPQLAPPVGPLEARLQAIVAKATTLPAGLVMPVALAVAFAAQASFDSGPSGRTLGAVLMVALIPVMGVFTYLESRSASTQAVAQPGVNLLPGPAPDFTALANYPRRTFL